jgi:hypothetical protein
MFMCNSSRIYQLYVKYVQLEQEMVKECMLKAQAKAYVDKMFKIIQCWWYDIPQSDSKIKSTRIGEM